jgi:hypothetical protein
VKLLRKNSEASNTELQEAYGPQLLASHHMGLLRKAVATNVDQPERYSLKELREHFANDEKAPSPKKRRRAALPVVDKLSGLKTFLDETVLPELLGYVVGSDVKRIEITINTDPSGNPILSRKIGRAVTEWDEHTLDFNK